MAERATIASPAASDCEPARIFVAIEIRKKSWLVAVGGPARRQDRPAHAARGRWRRAVGAAGQPDSTLSRWFRERVGALKDRPRRIAILGSSPGTALARKLLVALWRYLETGLVPAGATLKA